MPAPYGSHCDSFYLSSYLRRASTASRPSASRGGQVAPGAPTSPYLRATWPLLPRGTRGLCLSPHHCVNATYSWRHHQRPDKGQSSWQRVSTRHARPIHKDTKGAQEIGGCSATVARSTRSTGEALHSAIRCNVSAIVTCEAARAARNDLGIFSGPLPLICLSTCSGQSGARREP